MDRSLHGGAAAVCLAGVSPDTVRMNGLGHNRVFKNHFEVQVEQVDAVVMGAGVVGLAVARSLALAGHEVMVLESENAIGTGTSARNSEVIHAGIYLSLIHI